MAAASALRRRAACHRAARSRPRRARSAPGCTQPGVMHPGAPAAASRMSAARQQAARSGVFRWQSVTVASARVNSSAAGRPMTRLRPDDGHAFARRVDPVCAQQGHTRLSRAGGEARRTGHERAERCRCHAVHVLARIERVEQLLRAQRLRQRPQQQHAVHRAVRAQGAQGVGQGIGRAVRRQGHGAHGNAAAGRRLSDAAQIGPSSGCAPTDTAARQGRTASSAARVRTCT